MESWELIVSPTDTYVYTGIAPTDPKAEYVEVVRKERLDNALTALYELRELIGKKPVKINHSGGFVRLAEEEYLFAKSVFDIIDRGMDGAKGKPRNKRPFDSSMNYDDIPWTNVAKWKPGHWYPLPIGSNWTESCLYVVEGYDLFYQDPSAPEDCIPVGTPTMNFKEACDTCEFHNKEPLPGLR